MTVHDTVTVIAAPAPPVGVPSESTSFVTCNTALVFNIRDNNQAGAQKGNEVKEQSDSYCNHY